MSKQTINKDDKTSISNSTVISASQIPKMAIDDLLVGFKKFELWWLFAVFDIKQRFRRSLLGPLWLTISMGIFVGALGFVMSQLFKQDINTFLPYLATGVIFWTFITSVITEGCTSFVSAQGFIRNVPMPLSVHYYRMFARNLMIWMYNMAIYVIVFVVFVKELSLNLLLFLPGMVILSLNVLTLGMIAAIICTRFRDVPPIITSILQVVFFVTPIFWSAQTLPNRPAFIVFNPFYHLIEIVRAPLLGQAPGLISWVASIAIFAVSAPIAVYLYRRAFARISYWV